MNKPMNKDIKLPVIDRKLTMQNQELWGSIYRLKFTPFRESGLIQEIESIARQYAIEAVKLNMPEQQEPELIPFDLEAAKRGEPIITRDGRKARFIAYVPEADDGCRVVVFVEGSRSTRDIFDCGSSNWISESNDDIFMAPKPMKTVYVNFYKSGECFFYESESEARRRVASIATAIPVKIPA